MIYFKLGFYRLGSKYSRASIIRELIIQIINYLHYQIFVQMYF